MYGLQTVFLKTVTIPVFLGKTYDSRSDAEFVRLACRVLWKGWFPEIEPYLAQRVKPSP